MTRRLPLCSVTGTSLRALGHFRRLGSVGGRHQTWSTVPVPECRETITNRGLTVPEHQRASFFPGHSSNAYRANELIQGGIDDGAELRALAPGL